MTPQLKRILADQANSIADFHNLLLRALHHVTGSSVIKPGFQHGKLYREFEDETKFCTGEAICALARKARKELTKKERVRQKRIVTSLANQIVRNANPEDFTRRCLDVSNAVSLMLEEFGIWAHSYLGTLIYDAKSNGGRRYFYFVDDVFDPPENSEARGHSWIFTPVFPLMDFTARHQIISPYFRDNTPYPLLVENEDSIFAPQPYWYVDSNDPEMEQEAKFKYLSDHYPEYNTVHRTVTHRGTVDLLYVPMEMRFAGEPLEKWRMPLNIGGKTPYEFYKSVRDAIS